MSSFVEMAACDPEAAHLLNYKFAVRVLKTLERLHTERSNKLLQIKLKDGGAANMCVVIPQRFEPCREWESHRPDDGK